jgi:hypothetical protein
MTARFFKISNVLRDSINQSLDQNLTVEKIRPYFFAVKYKDYNVLVPLRSNCPQKYAIPIKHPDSSKKKHGLDCTTMLLLDNRQLSAMAERIWLHPEQVAHNVNKNYFRIKWMTLKTITDYKHAVEKKEAGLQLSKNESWLIGRCTLKNYHSELGIQNKISCIEIEENELDIAKKYIEKYRYNRKLNTNFSDIKHVLISKFNAMDGHLYMVEADLEKAKIIYKQSDDIIKEHCFENLKQMTDEFLSSLNTTEMVNTICKIVAKKERYTYPKQELNNNLSVKESDGIKL